MRQGRGWRHKKVPAIQVDVFSQTDRSNRRILAGYPKNTYPAHMDPATEIPSDLMADLIQSKSETDPSQYVPSETLLAEIAEAVNRIRQKAEFPV